MIFHQKTTNEKCQNTIFIWNGTNLAAETSKGNITNTYTYDITGIYSTNQNGTLGLYQKNPHGDVINIVNSSGTILNTYDYDAFGNEFTNEETINNPFRYCGEYYDNESNNIYLRARYYTPATGRFINEDPIKSGSNWYSYCSGNPVMFSDPSGLIRLDEEEIDEIRRQQAVLVSEQEETIDIYVTVSFAGDADVLIGDSGETYRQAIARGFKEGWEGIYDWKQVRVFVEDVSDGGKHENYKAITVNVDSKNNHEPYSYGDLIIDEKENKIYSNVNAMYFFKGFKNSSDLTNDGIAWFAAHELGHALGVGDLYMVPQFAENTIALMNYADIAHTALEGDYTLMFIAQNTNQYLSFSSNGNPSLKDYEFTILEKNRKIAANVLKKDFPGVER